MLTDEVEGYDYHIVHCCRCSAEIKINRIKVDDETCQQCDLELAELEHD